VIIGGQDMKGEAPGRVAAHGRRGKERFESEASAAVAAAPDAWHRYEIRCLGDTLSVSIDDRPVSDVFEVQNPQGFIALRTDAGTAEFRNVTMTHVRRPQPTPPEGVFVAGERAGIVLPRPSKQVPPRYTAEALRRRIQGPVLVTAVVEVDGRVGQVDVVQSLDPEFGLDNEALIAARQWRFEPGTQAGKAVPVLVSMELFFTLK
jgi:protein TonB